MKLFAVFASFAAAGQYQGVNEDGNEWTASVTEDTFAFQENGESLVATGSVVSDAGLINFKIRNMLKKQLICFKVVTKCSSLDKRRVKVRNALLIWLIIIVFETSW